MQQGHSGTIGGRSRFCGHQREYTLSELRSMLHHHGFELEVVRWYSAEKPSYRTASYDGEVMDEPSMEPSNGVEGLSAYPIVFSFYHALETLVPRWRYRICVIARKVTGK